MHKHTPMRRRRLAWAMVAALSTVSALAGAQPSPAEIAASKKTASQIADKAADAFEKGQYAAAVEGFRKAEGIFHAPTFQLLMARSQTKLGKLADARATYESIVQEKLPGYAPTEFFAAQKEASADLAALEPRVPKVRINAGATITAVTVDGQAVAAGDLARPVPLDPGTHEIVGRGAGSVEVRRSVTLKEGDSETVELAAPASALPTATATATATAPHRSPGRAPTGAIAAFAVAGAGLGVCITFGALSLGAKSDFDKLPTAPKADEGELFTRVADVGLGVAVLGAAVGAIVWWRVRVAEGKAAQGSPAQSIYVAPRAGGLTVGGAF
jgi:hypothetical protein